MYDEKVSSEGDVIAASDEAYLLNVHARIHEKSRLPFLLATSVLPMLLVREHFS